MAQINHGVEMTTYDGEKEEDWLDGLKESAESNARVLLCAFARLGIPTTYLDIGCGDGTMVRMARRIGVLAFGVDQLVVEGEWEPYFYHRNLVDKFTFPSPFDLVTCVEVAEHIHESAHATLCDTICENLSSGGGHLLFSAARPGQGGTGHISTRPAEYWGNEFTSRGLTQNIQLTMNLALLFSNINIAQNYFWDNLMVWEKS
jgi:cyclopropane fatty-acyl-phospholipid synthase-like methyltransferase